MGVKIEKKIEEFVKSPFNIVEKDDKWVIIMGKYVVKDRIETKEEAMRMIADKDWDIILTAAIIVIEETFTNKEEK